MHDARDQVFRRAEQRPAYKPDQHEPSQQHGGDGLVDNKDRWISKTGELEKRGQECRSDWLQHSVVYIPAFQNQ